MLFRPKSEKVRVWVLEKIRKEFDLWREMRLRDRERDFGRKREEATIGGGRCGEPALPIWFRPKSEKVRVWVWRKSRKREVDAQSPWLLLAATVFRSTNSGRGSGYALALDMTAREIQASAKSAGLPWTVAKGQDTFTPIGSVLPKESVPDPDNLELWLKVEGEMRQKGSTKNMIFRIPFLISHISSIITLLEGDVILTGIGIGILSISL